MSETQAYTVQFLDSIPEETNWLKRPGTVKITYPNGDTFEGYINKDKRKEGEGKYIWNNNTNIETQGIVSYEGMYVDGARHGLGKMIFPNGDSYHGLWENNEIEGEGTYKYSNGDIFSGFHKKGIKHGEGTYEYAADKSQLVGNWENGFITNGSWEFIDGTKYSSQFDKGMPIGKGVFTFLNGFEQHGEYIKLEPGPNQTKNVYNWVGSQLLRSTN